MARAGGAFGGGTVFQLDTNGKETVLYSFAGTPDGETPFSGIVRDGAGNPYGTTSAGGVRDTGTIFKIDSSGKETVLHSFINNTEGSEPSGLIREPPAIFMAQPFRVAEAPGAPSAAAPSSS